MRTYHVNPHKGTESILETLLKIKGGGGGGGGGGREGWRTKKKDSVVLLIFKVNVIPQ